MLEEKIAIIDDTIKDWSNQRSLRAEEFSRVKEAREIDYHDVWVDYLALDFPFKGTYLRVYNGRMEIHRDVDDRNRRELMTVYFREDWETKEFTELNTSVYSSSEDSQWELERLVTVGTVAQILLDHSDDILAALNTVSRNWKGGYDNAFKALSIADSMIDHWHKEKDKVYMNHAKELLMSEGLTFTDKLGSFDLRYDQNVNSIKTIKVTDVSASGKTCTVEVCPSSREKRRTGSCLATVWKLLSNCLKTVGPVKRFGIFYLPARGKIIKIKFAINKIYFYI